MASKHVGRPDGATRTEKKWPGYCKTFIVKDSNGTVKELVFPKALDLDRPKRDRTTFSNRQLGRLEEEFNTNQYIVGKDRTALAKCLGLSETQVKVWFQNRRTKLKKENGRNFEGNDSQAESKAAQNVLKLLAYQTSVSYPCLQNQVPAGHDPSAEARLSPNGPKLLPGVLAPHTCLHAETRNEKQWPSAQTTPEHNIPTFYASSAKDASKCPSDQKQGQTHLDSSKQDAVVHPDSSPLFQKHPRGLEVVCSKHDEDDELTPGPADYRPVPQTSDHDDLAGKYGSGTGLTHFPIRGFPEVITHQRTARPERASGKNTSHLNDSYNQDNTLLVDNKLEQCTTQRIIQTTPKETYSPIGCVQSHAVPSHRAGVSSWVQGYQSQYLPGPPFFPWYENGTFAPPSYSSIGQRTLHSGYCNTGSPNPTSAFSNIDHQVHTQYARFGQPNPNLYPELPGTTPLYSATDLSTLGSATFESQKYRNEFTMSYQSQSLGIHENTRKAIDLNLNKHLGLKFCTLQTPLSGAMRNEHMLNHLQTKFPYSYFNQS